MANERQINWNRQFIDLIHQKFVPAVQQATAKYFNQPVELVPMMAFYSGDLPADPITGVSPEIALYRDEFDPEGMVGLVIVALRQATELARASLQQGEQSGQLTKLAQQYGISENDMAARFVQGAAFDVTTREIVRQVFPLASNEDVHAIRGIAEKSLGWV
jgi:hypothetical protein